MQTSCISHPAHNPVAVVKRDYYEICDHNEVAAAILALLEYWHNVKLENQKQARHRNTVAANHGEAPTQDEDLWQWHTEESLEESLMGIGRRDAIRQAIKLLGAGELAVKDENGKEKKPEIVGKNFITVGLNPNPRYKFDRTRYFLFNPQPVQEAINKFYNQPVPNPIPDLPEPTNQPTSAENQGRQAENPFSSCKTTSKITTEREKTAPPSKKVVYPPEGTTDPEDALRSQNLKAICDVTAIDFWALGHFDRKNLSELNTKLTIDGETPATIRGFEEWYRRDNFNGRAGGRISMAAFQRNWGAYKLAASPPPSPSHRTYTDEELGLNFGPDVGEVKKERERGQAIWRLQKASRQQQQEAAA